MACEIDDYINVDSKDNMISSENENLRNLT
jgi:hypothetical protein